MTVPFHNDCLCCHFSNSVSAFGFFYWFQFEKENEKKQHSDLTVSLYQREKKLRQMKVNRFDAGGDTGNDNRLDETFAHIFPMKRTYELVQNHLKFVLSKSTIELAKVVSIQSTTTETTTATTEKKITFRFIAPGRHIKSS